LMVTAISNPTITREEVRCLFEQFGPIVKIVMFRQVVQDKIYNFSPIFVELSDRAAYTRALQHDFSAPDIRVTEVDDFFLQPYVAVVYGIPRSEDLLSYCDRLLQFGARQTKLLERVTG